MLHVAERAGVPHHELEELFAKARARRLVAPEPVDLGEARLWIEEAAAIALADGQVTHGEQQVLNGLGAAGGLSTADVRLLTAQVRQRLFAEAKAAIRAEKAARKKKG